MGVGVEVSESRVFKAVICGDGISIKVDGCSCGGIEDASGLELEDIVDVDVVKPSGIVKVSGAEVNNGGNTVVDPL